MSNGSSGSPSVDLAEQELARIVVFFLRDVAARCRTLADHPVAAGALRQGLTELTQLLDEHAERIEPQR